MAAAFILESSRQRNANLPTASRYPFEPLLTMNRLVEFEMAVNPALAARNGEDENPTAGSDTLQAILFRISQDKNVRGEEKFRRMTEAILGELKRRGRYYYHVDLKDFNHTYYFDATRRLLLQLRSDEFAAWLSSLIGVNRSERLFTFVMTELETEALARETSGILPASYWHAKPDAIYLSCGGGTLARISADGVTLADNGTDGVLFAAGKTLPTWQLTEPVSAFDTCRLFANVHTSARHGQLLLKTWVYSLPACPKNKPPLCLVGAVGSGKTRTIRGVAELYGLPENVARAEDANENDFWVSLDGGGVFILDNCDSKVSWLADACAAAATGGAKLKRQLYTDSSIVAMRANAWLALTSANPLFGNDSGLADRLLVARLERRQDEPTADSKLSEEIATNRDAALSDIAYRLAEALADRDPVPHINARHPDWNTLAVRLGRAFGREAETIAALTAAENDKSLFCLENDSIATTVGAYLKEHGRFQGRADELCAELKKLDVEMDWLTSKKLGKRLAALWPHLEKVHKVSVEKDRKGYSIYSLKTKSADCAEFQEAFSIKVA